MKSAKTHFKKTIGQRVLTYEEMTTIFIQIEAILNSRPLVALNDDPSDLRALTPGMLVSGKELGYVPLEDDEPILDRAPVASDEHPQKTWKFISNLVANFWRRWQKEYLSTLQPRKKWATEVPSLEVGDLVLVTDENLPPLQWAMGRVEVIYTGNDDVCRAVKVRTQKGVYQRPVVKLRRLPVDTKIEL